MVTKKARGAALLKVWRTNEKERGEKLSQLALAERLGLRGAMEVSRWERGVAVPTLANALELERMTGIPASAWVRR